MVSSRSMACDGWRSRSVNSHRKAVHTLLVVFSASSPSCLATGVVVCVMELFWRYLANLHFHSVPPSVCTSSGVPYTHTYASWNSRTISFGVLSLSARSTISPVNTSMMTMMYRVLPTRIDLLMVPMSATSMCTFWLRYVLTIFPFLLCAPNALYARAHVWHVMQTYSHNCLSFDTSMILHAVSYRVFPRAWHVEECIVMMIAITSCVDMLPLMLSSGFRTSNSLFCWCISSTSCWICWCPGEAV